MKSVFIFTVLLALNLVWGVSVSHAARHKKDSADNSSTSSAQSDDVTSQAMDIMMGTSAPVSEAAPAVEAAPASEAVPAAETAPVVAAVAETPSSNEAAIVSQTAPTEVFSEVVPVVAEPVAVEPVVSVPVVQELPKQDNQLPVEAKPASLFSGEVIITSGTASFKMRLAPADLAKNAEGNFSIGEIIMINTNDKKINIRDTKSGDIKSYTFKDEGIFLYFHEAQRVQLFN